MLIRQPYVNVVKWCNFNINTGSFRQVYGNVTRKLFHHMTTLYDDIFAMLIRGHFNKHISTLSDDSFLTFMQCHIGNHFAMLSNDINLTSILSLFGKHISTLTENFITIWPCCPMMVLQCKCKVILASIYQHCQATLLQCLCNIKWATIWQSCQLI